MRVFSRFAFLALGIALLTGASRTALADPVTTIHFTGVCADCLGTGTGTLVVQNYTPGDRFTLDNFVSFNYSSNLITQDYEASDVNTFSGSVGSTPGAYTVAIFTNIDDPYEEDLITGGSYWCVGQECGADQGRIFIWSLVPGSASTVPEPGTFSLLGTGFAGIAAMRRRFRRV